MPLERALTILAGERGIAKITVHRDPTENYSAQAGLKLLRRLAPLLEQLDRAAVEAEAQP